MHTPYFDPKHLVIDQVFERKFRWQKIILFDISGNNLLASDLLFEIFLSQRIVQPFEKNWKNYACIEANNLAEYLSFQTLQSLNK